MIFTNLSTEELDLKSLVDDLFSEAAECQGDHADDFDPKLWSKLGDLGLSRLTAPESVGGSGASWAQAGIVLSSAAVHAIQTPIAEHDLLAGWFLRAAWDPDGSSDFDTFGLSKDGTRCVLPWSKVAETAVLLHQEDAQWLYARLDLSGHRDAQDVSFGGVTWASIHGLDQLNWKPLNDANLGTEAIRRGAAVRSVQIAGAMEGMAWLTAGHAKMRTQFGQPLVRFQAVQRLLADLAAESALASASVVRLLDALAADAAGDEHVAVAASCVGHAAEVVVRAAHQVHGAIGTTREHRLHRYSGAIYAWSPDFGGSGTWDRWLSAQIAQSAKPAAHLWNLVTGV